MNKWHMENPKSVPENETNKIICDFVIHTNLLILARLSDIQFRKKKTGWNVHITGLDDHRVKLKEDEKRYVPIPI